MALCSVLPSVKAKLVPAVAAIALGASAAVCCVATALLGGDGPAPLPPEAELVAEVGLLDPREAAAAGGISSLAVSPDGALLATATRDGVVRLWAASDQRPLARWQAHLAMVTALAFFPDGRSLLTAGADRTVACWPLGEAPAPRPDGRWPVPALVTALAVGPDGRTAALASRGRLRLSDAGHGTPLGEAELPAPHCPIVALAFAPDGRSLACGGADNAARVWALGGGPPRLRLTLRHADNWVRGLAYRADGRTLISLDTAGLVRAWDREGNLLGTAHAGESPCPRASLGGGGRLVLTATGCAGSARLWRLPDGR
jgi:WD40 repeat protein